MNFFKKIIFVYFYLNFIKYKKGILFNDLNFRKLDFNNYKQIRTFIFKKDFFKIKSKYIQNFDFLNFSKNLGGKIGINLSKKSIFDWYLINKNKFGFPWSEDLISRRFLNIIYNYEFINSSSNERETKLLNKILFIHMYRIIYDFKNKNIGEITSYDILANVICLFLLKRFRDKNINFIEKIIERQIDTLGMHKSYNIVEHARFMNNINELKNVLLYFNHNVSDKFDELIFKMESILNEYFHQDGSIALFNGSNNNYTKIIKYSLNKDEHLVSRSFSNIKNGIAFYADKSKKIFFDVVQPNKNKISKDLSAGTLSFEYSCLGEKIITNCGASESFGKNPEYLRYSAAHSTVIIQNTNISEIKENNPHIRFPQLVSYASSKLGDDKILEGSHNGYVKKYNKIIKRRLIIPNNENKIYGEDTIITISNLMEKVIYHIRFHLVDGITFNFTNNKKNIILRTKLNNMWLFKCDSELGVEDSILVDNNVTLPTKQIVIKGLSSNSKQKRKWSIEKI